MEELKEKLRAEVVIDPSSGLSVLINPDGPAAAAAIERLEAEIADLKHDLERQMTIANIECNEAEEAKAEIVKLRGAAVTLLEKVDANSAVRWQFVNERESLRSALNSAALTPDSQEGAQS